MQTIFSHSLLLFIVREIWSFYNSKTTSRVGAAAVVLVVVLLLPVAVVECYLLLYDLCFSSYTWSTVAWSVWSDFFIALTFFLFVQCIGLPYYWQIDQLIPPLFSFHLSRTYLYLFHEHLLFKWLCFALAVTALYKRGRTFVFAGLFLWCNNASWQRVWCCWKECISPL